MNAPPEMLEDFRNHMWACFKYLGLGDPTYFRSSSLLFSYETGRRNY